MLWRSFDAADACADMYGQKTGGINLPKASTCVCIHTWIQYKAVILNVDGCAGWALELEMRKGDSIGV